MPEFINSLTKLGAEVHIEEGYGSRLGYTFDDFRHGNPDVFSCSRVKAFQKDVVLILRSPKPDEFQLLGRNSTLISMMHYPTRPKRVARLKEHYIDAISLESIMNDHNLRMVENMKAVAWNGLEAAYDHLEHIWPGLALNWTLT